MKGDCAESVVMPSVPRDRPVFIHRDRHSWVDSACVRAGSLTKLLLRLRKLQGSVPYKLTAEAMLFVAAILRLGESAQMAHPIDADSQDRMVTCLEVLPCPTLTVSCP